MSWLNNKHENRVVRHSIVHAMLRLIKYCVYREVLKDILRIMKSERLIGGNINWMCICKKLQDSVITRLEFIKEIDVVDYQECKKYRERDPNHVVKEALKTIEKQISTPSVISKKAIVGPDDKSVNSKYVK